MGGLICGKIGPAEQSAEYSSGRWNRILRTTPSTKLNFTAILGDASERTERMREMLGPIHFVKKSYRGI